jgi:hypothetical protein
LVGGIAARRIATQYPAHSIAYSSCCFLAHCRRSLLAKDAAQDVANPSSTFGGTCCTGVAAQYLTKNVAKRASSARTTPSSASKDLTKNVAKPTTRTRTAGRGASSASKHLTKNVADPTAAARGPSHLLRESAHYHRGDDRQHLLEDTGTNPGDIGGMRGDSAAHLLRPEYVTQYRVAIIDHTGLVAIEITAVIAVRQGAKQAGHAIRRTRLSANAGHDRRPELVNRCSGLIFAQIELSTKVLQPPATLALCDDFGEIHVIVLLELSCV